MATAPPADPLRDYFRDVFLIGHPEATRLLLVRHGQAGNNVVGLVLDSTEAGEDPPLTKLGFRQATRVGKRLAKEGVDRIYCSSLLRTRQTAEPLAEALGMEIEPLADIREVELHNVNVDMTDGQLRRRITRAMLRRPSWDAFPGAEPSRDFRARVQRGFDEIVGDNPGKRVAVFCHGGVIQVYVSIILGLKADIIFYPFNAGITSIRALGDQRTLWRMNDISHLVRLTLVS